MLLHLNKDHMCPEQVFVGGVPRGATEEQIKEYASKVGPVRLSELGLSAAELV